MLFDSCLMEKMSIGVVSLVSNSHNFNDIQMRYVCEIDCVDAIETLKSIK